MAHTHTHTTRDTRRTRYESRIRFWASDNSKALVPAFEASCSCSACWIAQRAQRLSETRASWVRACASETSRVWACYELSARWVALSCRCVAQMAPATTNAVEFTVLKCVEKLAYTISTHSCELNWFKQPLVAIQVQRVLIAQDLKYTHYREAYGLAFDGPYTHK